MNDLLLNLYKMVSVLIAIVDIVLAIKAFGKKSHTGLYLGLSCVGAAVVDISYLVSIMRCTNTSQR